MNWFRRVPKWLLALILGGVSISFVFWGIGNVFSFSSASPMISVGDSRIYTQDFQREFSRYLKEREQNDQEHRQISTEEGRALGLDYLARDRLVIRLLMEKKARDLGLAVSRDQIVDVLKGALGDGHGNIDAQRFHATLESYQMSEPAFIAQLQGDMVQRQLYGTILSNVALPPGMITILHHYRLERRVAEYVVIDPARAGEIKDPAESMLRQYYSAHIEQFSAPEYRAVTVASASAKDVAAQMDIKDEEIQKVFALNKSRYETPEKRTMEQIQFPSEEKARAAHAALASGKSFEQVAKEAGFKPDDIKLGEVSAGDTSMPAVGFSLELMKPSEPVKNAFGRWIILRATASTPGTAKTFAEVRQEIRDAIASEKAKDQVFKLSTDYDNARGGGMSIEDAAKKLSLKLTKIAALDKTGKNDTGQTLDLPVGGDFLSRIFGAEIGTDSLLQESADNVYYEYRVDTVKPAARKPFESVRNDVLAMWRAEQEHQRLQAIADDLVKRGNAGTTIAKLAAPLGVAPLKSDPLPRKPEQKPVSGVFSEAALKALFDTKVGGFFSGPVADGKSIVVARVDSTSQ